MPSVIRSSLFRDTVPRRCDSRCRQLRANYSMSPLASGRPKRTPSKDVSVCGCVNRTRRHGVCDCVPRWPSNHFLNPPWTKRLLLATDEPQLAGIGDSLWQTLVAGHHAVCVCSVCERGSVCVCVFSWLSGHGSRSSLLGLTWKVQCLRCHKPG